MELSLYSFEASEIVEGAIIITLDIDLQYFKKKSCLGSAGTPSFLKLTFADYLIDVTHADGSS